MVIHGMTLRKSLVFNVTGCFGKLVSEILDLNIRNFGKSPTYTEFQVSVIIHSSCESSIFCNLTLDLLSLLDESSIKRVVIQHNLLADGKTPYRFIFYHRNKDNCDGQHNSFKFKIIPTAIIEH